MRFLFRNGVTAAALWLIACVSDQPTVDSGSGELGKGSLLLVCTDDDATCPRPDDSPLPSIAVGASFSMTYEGRVPNSPNGKPTQIILFSASPPMLTVTGTEMVARLPGQAAVLARTSEGTVTDFVHVNLASPHSILVEGNSLQKVGSQNELVASPLGADGQVLGGTLSYSWTLEGTAVGLLDNVGRKATLVAREVGTSIVRTQSGEVTGEFEITVEAP